ncbi:MAG: helix-turn-helix transcriptional regulator [Candidatus Zixiibacteriota bacterium]
MERSGYSHVYRTVGKAIAEARRNAARRLTQQQLADRTGGELTRSAVANIESGRQRLAVHHLYLIARGLDVDPARLLPSVEDMFPSGDETLQSELAKDPKLAKWLSKVVRRPITAEQ